MVKTTITPDQRKLWTKAGQRAIFRKIRGSDPVIAKEAFDQFFEANLPLVHGLVGRMKLPATGAGDMDDMLQAGAMGLMVAIKKFDPTRNLAFSTYATRWILQYAGRYRQHLVGPVHIPCKLQDRQRKIRRFASKTARTTSFLPTESETADHLEITLEELHQHRSRMPKGFFSMDDDRPSPQSTAHKEGKKSIPCPAFTNHDALLNETMPEIHRRDQLQAIRAAVQDLPERLRKVISLHYGLDGRYGHTHTYREISEKLGVSHQWVRELEKKALRALKRGRALREIEGL